MLCLFIMPPYYTGRKITEWDKIVHTFLCYINQKGNLIARLALELAYNDAGVQHVSHTMGTPPHFDLIRSHDIYSDYWLYINWNDWNRSDKHLLFSRKESDGGISSNFKNFFQDTCGPKVAVFPLWDYFLWAFFHQAFWWYWGVSTIIISKAHRYGLCQR